jgi:3',5'-cyclic AMP phosphodiesterase CpdA
MNVKTGGADMRIVLLSDIHFGKDGCSYDFSAIGDDVKDIEYEKSNLKKSLFESLKDQNIDLVLIAGDITSTGSPSEFFSFKKFLDEMSTEVEIPLEKIIWIGGNHDIWRVPIEKAGSIPAKTLLEQERWASFQRVGAKIMDVILGVPESKCPTAKSDDYATYYNFDEIGIFTLHSAFDADHILYEYGTIGSAQLAWLEKALSQCACKWKIIMLHHHPIEYEWPELYKDKSSLKEGLQICKTAAKHSVDLICHGHRHLPKATNVRRGEWDANISFLCAGSLSVNAKNRYNGSTPNLFHILDLKEDGTTKYIELTNYEYSISQGWSVIKGIEKPELPIQGKIVLCSTVPDDQIITLLRQYIVHEGLALEIPAFGNLPYQLQSKTFINITSIIRAEFDSQYDIPDDYIGDRIVYWKKAT